MGLTNTPPAAWPFTITLAEPARDAFPKVITRPVPLGKRKPEALFSHAFISVEKFFTLRLFPTYGLQTHSFCCASPLMYFYSGMATLMPPGEEFRHEPLICAECKKSQPFSLLFRQAVATNSRRENFWQERLQDFYPPLQAIVHGQTLQELITETFKALAEVNRVSFVEARKAWEQEVQKRQESFASAMAKIQAGELLA